MENILDMLGLRETGYDHVLNNKGALETQFQLV